MRLPRLARWLAAALALLAAATLAVVAVDKYSHPQAGAITVESTGGTFNGLGGTVVLTVPEGAAAPHTTVTITNGTMPSLAVAAGATTAVQLTPLVNVDVQHGQLAHERVRITLKLPAGRPAAVYRDAYIAVYEPEIGAFVPLLDSHANPNAHTVTAIAPHFSGFMSLANTASNGLGHIVDWGDKIVLPWLPLVPSLDKAVKDIQHEEINALLGNGPKLKCSPKSRKLKVSVHDFSHGQLLDACVEDYTDNSGRAHVRIGNHYGYPILYSPPPGFTVGLKDFDFTGNTTMLDFLRHVLWMNFNRAEAPGADNTSLTYHANAQLPAAIDGTMDWAAVGVDMAYAIASIVVPELKEMSPELRATLEKIIASIADSQTEGKAGAEAFAAAAQSLISQAQNVATMLDPLLHVLDIGECVYSGVQAAPELKMDGSGFFGHLGTKTSAAMKIAYECVRGKLADLGGEVTKLLDSVAGDLKIIPEAAYATAAAKIDQLGLDATDSSIEVKGASLSDGTHYAFFSKIDLAHRGVSFNEVQYFQGPTAAMQACIQDHVPNNNGELCNDYYIRDLHHEGAIPVAPNATILDWHAPDGGVVNDQPTTLASVAQWVNRVSGSSYLWKIVVSGGRIVYIEGIYHP